MSKERLAAVLSVKRLLDSGVPLRFTLKLTAKEFGITLMELMEYCDEADLQEVSDWIQNIRREEALKAAREKEKACREARSLRQDAEGGDDPETDREGGGDRAPEGVGDNEGRD